MKSGDWTFELSTGRKFYCCCLTACPDPDEFDPLNLAYGHDGSIGGTYVKDKYEEELQPFTDAERREIADYFVGLWSKWADGTISHKDIA